MLEPIDLADLARVTGGKACPKYRASPEEITKRSKMSAKQLAKRDRKWAKTIAHIAETDPDRLADIQRKAAGYAAEFGPCTGPEIGPPPPLTSAPERSLLDDLNMIHHH
jgi:hypothetical protein